MENASKALLIGASTLIGILLIGLATYFFKSASQVTKTYDTTLETSEISSFNANFTRFIGAGVVDKDGTTTQQYATIYDIISLAYFAYNYNYNTVEDPEDSSDPTIIRINVQLTKTKSEVISNLQYKSNQSKYNEYLKEYYYIRNDSPKANQIITYEITELTYNATGRVNNVTFRPYEENEK